MRSVLLHGDCGPEVSQGLARYGSNNRIAANLSPDRQPLIESAIPMYSASLNCNDDLNFRKDLRSPALVLFLRDHSICPELFKQVQPFSRIT